MLWSTIGSGGGNLSRASGRSLVQDLGAALDQYLPPRAPVGAAPVRLEGDDPRLGGDFADQTEPGPDQQVLPVQSASHRDDQRQRALREGQVAAARRQPAANGSARR